MSWKRSGQLISGPPTGSNTNKQDPRFKPNLGGLTAFQREQQIATRYGPSDPGPSRVRSEWDVLKENHRFIRDDEDVQEVSWEERLARAYESKLFKEFALIDLKHFKSKRLALRWRTAPEVVEGIGEDTCASLRCKYHKPVTAESHDRQVGFDTETPRPDDSISVRGHPNEPGSRRRRKGKKEKVMPQLRSFELPFVYSEAGERKEALVKVRLCPKCQAKLTWKPGKEEPGSGESEDEDTSFIERHIGREGNSHRSSRRRHDEESHERRRDNHESSRRHRDEDGRFNGNRDRKEGRHRRKSSSRSRSPRRRKT